MLLKFTQIRQRFVEGKKEKGSGHQELYGHPIQVAAHLIQAILPVPHAEYDFHKGPQAQTIIIYGLEQEFFILESPEQVSAAIEHELSPILNFEAVRTAEVTEGDVAGALREAMIRDAIRDLRGKDSRWTEDYQHCVERIEAILSDDGAVMGAVLG